MVTEIDCLRAHGSIVAREYGSLMVMGVNGAKQPIVDGQIITDDEEGHVGIQRLRNITGVKYRPQRDE